MTRAPQLEDADWLRERYLISSDSVIAAELGVHYQTVLRARHRHGIAGAGARGGRRSGSSPTSAAAVLIAERIAHESAKGPVGPAVVSERVRAVHRAHVAGDVLGLEDAIAGAAAALGLWLDQLLSVRAA